MNLLLTSVGRRTYLVNYFKEVIGAAGQVHVANSSPVTPSFVAADQSVVTPLIYEESYIPFLLDYCRDNHIDVIISLFDIDLPILAANKERFAQAGVRVLVSDKEVIDICNDKWNTYNFLIENGFRAAKTYLSLEEVSASLKAGEISFPVIIKPRWGMGSIAVFEAENQLELEVLYAKVLRSIQASYLKYEAKESLEQSVLIQEKLNGEEYGLDVINDLNGEYQNTIVKKKYAMRSGETDCAETMTSPALENVGEALSRKLKHIGNLDTDVFLVEGEPYVLEMNARFGGGYPFSHLAGVNLPLAIRKWLSGEPVEPRLLQARAGLLVHKDISLVDITAIPQLQTVPSK